MDILYDTVILSNLKFTEGEPEYVLNTLGYNEISTSQEIEYKKILREVIRPETEIDALFQKYPTKKEYYGPFSFQKTKVVFWKLEEEVIAMITDIQDDISWLIQSVTYHLEFKIKLTKESIIELRYKFPVLVAIDPRIRNFQLQDPFRSIPNTFFKAAMRDEPFSESLDSDLGNLILRISKYLPTMEEDTELKSSLNGIFVELFSANSKERYYVAINLLEAVIFSSIQKDRIRDLILNNFQAQILSLNEEGYNNLAWIYKIYLNFYFKTEYEIENKGFENYEIPDMYHLIPFMLEYRSNSLENPDEFLNQLNKEIMLRYDHYLYEQGFMYQAIADLSFQLKNYNKATTYYALASESYTLQGDKDVAIACQRKSVESTLMHYLEYSTASNLFYYLGQTSEGIKMGWMALNLSMRIVKKALSISISFTRRVVEGILEKIDESKRPLLVEENDMTPVVELKISELENYYRQLLTDEWSEDRLDEAIENIEIHRESIRFLMPFTPPIFLFLTPDGRLIYSVKATSDLELDETHLSHLMAGVLTAVRTIFVEASFSGGGTVKEINTGDSTLLIEARDSIVVAVSSLNMTQDIRNFTMSIADLLDEEYSELFEDWDGGTEMVEPMIEVVNKKILSDLVN